jgi:hypothetical protein
MTSKAQNPQAAADDKLKSIVFENNNVIRCNVDVSNFVQADITLSGKLDINQQISLSTQLTAYMSSNITAIAQQTTGWMSLFSSGNKAENIQRIVDHVSLAVNQNVIKSSLNDVYSSMYNSQNVTVKGNTFDCTGMADPVQEFGNQALVTIIANAISKDVTKVTQDNSIEIQALANMKSEIQQSAGTGGSWIKWVFIILAIGLVIGFIIYIIILTRKQQPQKK